MATYRITLRDYLLPDSQRGPVPELTLNPMAIALQRPSTLRNKETSPCNRL